MLAIPPSDYREARRATRVAARSTRGREIEHLERIPGPERNKSTRLHASVRLDDDVRIAAMNRPQERPRRPGGFRRLCQERAAQGRTFAERPTSLGRRRKEPAQALH